MDKQRIRRINTLSAAADVLQALEVERGIPTHPQTISILRQTAASLEAEGKELDALLASPRKPPKRASRPAPRCGCGIGDSCSICSPERNE